MTDVPNTKERRVLDVLASGDPEPASEFLNVGETTLSRMCLKRWIRGIYNEARERTEYVITDDGEQARKMKPVRKPASARRLKPMPDRLQALPPRLRSLD